MKTWFTLPRLLRILAILIAALGVLDPVIITSRISRADLVVLAAGEGDAALRGEVARTLASRFDVLDTPSSSADATVIVGTHLPAGDPPGKVVFAVLPRSSITIERLDVPAIAPLEGRVPVSVAVRVRGARGRSVELQLHDGPLVVDRRAEPVVNDSALITIPLSFAPTEVGVSELQLSASIVGEASGPVAVARVAVQIRNQRWPVLFHDPRPSWMGTFVRRAIEADPRFEVTSRVVTSRNVSTDAGVPPSSLSDDAALAGYRVVIVAAPSQLSESEVGGLERYLRQHAGQLLFLLDDPGSGPFRRLLGTTRWRSDSGVRVDSIIDASGGAVLLRASELSWPEELPRAATLLARTVDTRGAARAIIWQLPVGAGGVTISGALDAWRYRSTASSDFNRFWARQIATMAADTPSPLELRLSKSAIEPADSVELSVTLVEKALQSGTRPVHARVTGIIDAPDGKATPFRLWPGTATGELQAVLRPETPGMYRIIIESEGARAELPLLVMTGSGNATPDATAVLAAWAASHGGESISAARLPALPDLIQHALHLAPRRQPWHPMRSAWWILPFAMLLSAEWFLRRRRGLA